MMVALADTPFSSPRPASELTPGDYARRLLDGLGWRNHALRVQDQRGAAALWADSGAMALSGTADGPPRQCAAPLAACAQGVWLALASLFPDHFDARFPAHRLLGERAALLGFGRQGGRSPGGACRLLSCGDGVVALNLPRADDFALLPAWLQLEASDWADLEALLPSYRQAHLLERARLLGLACAASVPPVGALDYHCETRCAAPVAPKGRAPLVVDLSGLWAGPMCGQLLKQAGARVIKVECQRRPDGARFGSVAFFDLMNAGKESVALDLSSATGQSQLAKLLRHADIVIESTRPRALEQMGICAASFLAQRPGGVWLSITGYGRRQPMADWIAYGDDAGVAAGLSWLTRTEGDAPVFCGDAIADPLTGLHGALLVLSAWRRGGGVLLDLPLSRVVGFCIQAGSVDVHSSLDMVTPPIARTPLASAAPLGEHTDAVLGAMA